jgi:hypothetical protein
VTVVEDLRELQLDVYDTKLGWWTPDHGDIEIPDDWDFLPAGDAFLTRTVKAAGHHWTAWLPRRRNRPHRRRVGLWAPAAAIAEARGAAKATEEARARRRKSGDASRARSEARYQQELAQAIVAFLDFAPTHAHLASRIARESAARAAVVGSGRVGRTRTLSIEERAVLAARAYIRHRFTTYDGDLDALWDEDPTYDDSGYREVKADAQEAVDDFLEQHRQNVG